MQLSHSWGDRSTRGSWSGGPSRSDGWQRKHWTTTIFEDAGKIKRVVRSSIAAEALSLLEGMKDVIYLRAMLIDIWVSRAFHASWSLCWQQECGGSLQLITPPALILHGYTPDRLRYLLSSEAYRALPITVQSQQRIRHNVSGFMYIYLTLANQKDFHDFNLQCTL